VPHLPGVGLPKNFLRPCLLLLLREREAHGYELLELIDPFGFDQSDPGALYRLLRKLESDGVVSSRWRPSPSGPPKRVYALTAAGEEELDRRATELAEGERRIDAFLDRYLRIRQLRPSNARERPVVQRYTAHRAAIKSRPPLESR
jgi:PadR family transcriptional regulator PadR